MDIYDSDDTNTYRINLKWMKRKIMMLMVGKEYDEIYDNGWYPAVSEHDIQLVTKSRKVKTTLGFLMIVPTKIIRKSTPIIYIKHYEYLTIFSSKNGNLFYYYDSFFRKLNKCSYNKVLKIRLGEKKIL